ncbi:MAG: hypothetical protein KJO07_00930 [Deltaproteobacteria bacterium]|nr:hypothetical protein [Deltaproteobacteria bacterium]
MRPTLAIFTSLATLALLSTSAEAGTAQVMRYMPSDTAAFVTVDVAKVRTTDLGKAALRVLSSDKRAKRDLDKFQKATGLDVRGDISAGAVFLPTSLIEGKGENFLLVAEGRFQKARIEAWVRKESKSVKVARHAGRKLLIIDDEGALAFDGRYALLGTIAQVKLSLSNRAKGGRAAARVAKVARTRGDVRAGMYFPAGMRQQMGRDVPPAGNLSTASAVVRTGKTMTLQVKLNFTKAKSAATTTQILQQQLVELAKDRSIQKMGLDKLLAKTVVSQSGSAVTVNSKAQSATVMALLNQIFNLMR